MKVKDFYYQLPGELIAQEPVQNRSMSRLFVLERLTGKVQHGVFKEIINYLNKGDCLVLNNTRVMPARLLGNSEETEGKIEFVLLNQIGDKIWEVILKPGRRAKLGKRFVFGGGLLKAEIIKIIENGNRWVKFEYDGIFREILDKVGIIPLPPYITKNIADPERYQTVYSKINGSSAAPTAGLHFTEELLKEIRLKGIKTAFITLHVGLGTFRPVKTQNVEEHHMHAEYYDIKVEECKKINDTRKEGGKIIAVGTTSCRVLETVGDEKGVVKPFKGKTDIFIYPGYNFKVIDGLITNFHLPESTLIMLVSAFAGKGNIMNAYDIAIENRYRFFSFGDAMLIL